METMEPADDMEIEEGDLFYLDRYLLVVVESVERAQDSDRALRVTVRTHVDGTTRDVHPRRLTKLS